MWTFRSAAEHASPLHFGWGCRQTGTKRTPSRLLWNGRIQKRRRGRRRVEGSCSVIYYQIIGINGINWPNIACETCSWIKFEEDVEDGGNRWTKPFVGTLSLHALFELRSSLLNGTLLLDADATTVEEVTSVIVDKVCSTHQLTADQKNQVCNHVLIIIDKRDTQ